MSERFQIGDRVRFLNDEGEGKIISFPSNGWAMVEDASGFAFEHPEKELVLIKDPRIEWKGYESNTPDIQDIVVRNTDDRVSKKANDDFKVLYKNKNATNVRKRGEVMEIDLHIHELMDRHNGMTNGEIIAIQLEHFERMLRSAEEHKIERMVVIHGVGQGVLRAEIRKMLNQFYPHCEFMDAPYHEYGQGATEIRIRKMYR